MYRPILRSGHATRTPRGWSPLAFASPSSSRERRNFGPGGFPRARRLCIPLISDPSFVEWVYSVDRYPRWGAAPRRRAEMIFRGVREALPLLTLVLVVAGGA